MIGNQKKREPKDVIMKYLHKDIFLCLDYLHITLEYLNHGILGVHEYPFERNFTTDNIIKRNDEKTYKNLYDNKEILITKAFELINNDLNNPKFYQLNYYMFEKNVKINTSTKYKKNTKSFKSRYNYSLSYGVYVDFANQTLGGGWRTTGFLQEEIMIFQIPEFAMFLLKNDNVSLRDNDIPSNDIKYTPVIIKDVQHTLYIDKLYGRSPLNSLNGNIDGHILKSGIITNILCISAPNLGYRIGFEDGVYKENGYLIDKKGVQYSQTTIYDLLMTLYTGFKFAKQMVKSNMVNSGKIGCGVFYNNVTVVLICHMIISEILCIDIALYGIKEKEFEYAEDIYIKNREKLNGCDLNGCSQMLHKIIHNEINGDISFAENQEKEFYQMNGLMDPDKI